MKALITGASSGLGKDFAIELSKQGYDLVLVSRSEDKLLDLKKELNTNVEIETMDLSIMDNVIKLHNKYSNKIDLLINNAGFGTFGKFYETDLLVELNMIDLNIKTYHVLTKLFLIDFVKRDSGRILNVASSAAFQPGPLMDTYYSTKAYVYSMSMGIYEELRRDKSNVKINILCPGPVDTSFNDRAKVSFGVKSLKSIDVVRYAIKCMNKNKLVIIPSLKMKISVFANRFLSRKSVIKITYNIQKSKIN
ncbi:MAG: SDR family oxidoreductase [Tenericutes bacterium]|nr:SDR family oxidoreductase [Mycoplasmatota bacterium]